MAGAGRECLALPMHLHAPSLARRYLSLVGAGWPVDVLETVKLATSELVANAVRYGDGPLVLVVDVRPETVRVEVHDTGAHRLPGPSRDSRHEGEGGRGLLIVDAVAARWGVSETALPPGKAVWFEFGLTA